MVKPELVIAILDTASFVLVTPQLVGIENLRNINRFTFRALLSFLFKGFEADTFWGMFGLTFILVMMVIAVNYYEIPWLTGIDQNIVGSAINNKVSWTPMNIVVLVANVVSYGIVPFMIVLGWLEVLMTRFDPAFGMLLAGALLFAAARFLSIYQSIYAGG